jgi:hypothetical protein
MGGTMTFLMGGYMRSVDKWVVNSSIAEWGKPTMSL